MLTQQFLSFSNQRHTANLLFWLLNTLRYSNLGMVYKQYSITVKNSDKCSYSNLGMVYKQYSITVSKQ